MLSQRKVIFHRTAADGFLVACLLVAATSWGWCGTDPSEVGATRETIVSYEIISIPFEWYDIQHTGIELYLGDDDCDIVQVPFDVTVFDHVTDSLWICNNGVVSPAVSFTHYENECLPYQAEVPLVLPFWDDLSDQSGSVLYQYVSTADGGLIIVQWNERAHYSSPATISFQVEFFEQSGEILFNYADTVFDGSVIDNGASATVGLQRSGQQAIEFSCNSASLSNLMSIRWVPLREGDSIFADGFESGDTSGWS